MENSPGAKPAEVKPLRSWAVKYVNKLPFPRPWYLSATDAQDVMGQVWLNIVAGGHLDREVHISYLRKAVRNELRRRGLTQRALGATREALSAHVIMQEEHANNDFMDALQRRLSLDMAARYFEERHHRALELLLEGNSSAEVAAVLRRKYGWHVTADAVRQWHRRHINPFYMAEAA